MKTKKPIRPTKPLAERPAADCYRPEPEPRPEDAPACVAARREYDAAFPGVYREALRPLAEIEAELATATGPRKTLLDQARLLASWPRRHSTDTLKTLAAAPTFETRERIRTEEQRAAEARLAQEEAKRKTTTERNAVERKTEADRREAEAREQAERERKAMAAEIVKAMDATQESTTRACPEMMTIHEAAKYCRCSEKTIRNRLHKVNHDGTPMLAGVIGKGRYTRIPRAALEPFRKRPKATEKTPLKRPARPARKVVKRRR